MPVRRVIHKPERLDHPAYDPSFSARIVMEPDTPAAQDRLPERNKPALTVRTLTAQCAAIRSADKCRSLCRRSKVPVSLSIRFILKVHYPQEPFRGCLHLRREKRLKSLSVLIQSQSYTIARAACQASATSLP